MVIKMERTKKECPVCESVENQMKKGFTGSGTQRYMCRDCGVTYTLERKKREYSEETKKLALKMYYSGMSGRSVGKAWE